MPDNYDRTELHERAANLGVWDHGFTSYVNHFFPQPWSRRDERPLGAGMFAYRSLCGKYDIDRGEVLPRQSFCPSGKVNVCNVCLQKWASLLMRKLPTSIDWPYQWLDPAGRRLVEEAVVAHKDWVRLLAAVADLQGSHVYGVLPHQVAPIYYADKDWWDVRRKNSAARKMLTGFIRTGTLSFVLEHMESRDWFYKLSVFGEDVIDTARRRLLDA